MRRLEDMDITGKTVLLQMSLDTPLHEGVVADDSRLRASEPTIRYLLEKNCKIIVCGHVGRPKDHDPTLSTRPVAAALEHVLGTRVHHIEGVIGEHVKTAIEEITAPNVIMLENTRYEEGEQKADAVFAKELASYAQAFVSDDYPSAHRAFAINTIIPTLLPSGAGKSMQKEYAAITSVRDNPEKPLVLIIGGAKADKMGVIDHMLGIADTIIVGGVLANTMLKANGINMQGSKVDEASQEIAGEYLRDQEEKFLLPVDVIAAETFAQDAQHKECTLQDIPQAWTVLDIGSQTRENYARILATAKTIIWGGPIGVFEWEAFAQGTRAVANAIAQSNAFSVVAGGDSGDAVRQLGFADKISHLSIGGGATLALIAGEELPAIQALE